MNDKPKPDEEAVALQPVVGRRRKFTMTADYGTTTRNAMCYDFYGLLAFVEYELAHGAESVTATVHWTEPPNDQAKTRPDL